MAPKKATTTRKKKKPVKKKAVAKGPSVRDLESRIQVLQTQKAAAEAARDQAVKRANDAEQEKRKLDRDLVEAKSDYAKLEKTYKDTFRKLGEDYVLKTERDQDVANARGQRWNGNKKMYLGFIGVILLLVGGYLALGVTYDLFQPQPDRRIQIEVDGEQATTEDTQQEGS